MEEALESVVSPILQRLTYDPDATWDWSEIARDGLLGVAIGGVLGGVGGSANERAAYRNAQQTPSVQQSTGVQPEVQQTQQSQTQQATQNNTAPYTQQEAARTDVIADYQRQEHHGNILDTVRENLPNLESMPSVHALTGKEFQRVSGDNRNLRTKVIDFFNSIGNKITRPGFGDIELNTAGTRDSLAHGYGKLKASAFAALPSILTKGRLISRRGPYPGHNYNSYIFAAPVDIGNERCYVGALVIQDDKTQRYKLHEVLATNKNGVSLFQSESDNTAAGPLRNDTPPGEPPGSPAFNVSIPQARTGVNTEYAHGQQKNTAPPNLTPQEAPAPTAGTPDMGTGTQRAETASAPEGMGAASLGFHPDAYVRWYEIFKTEEAEKGGTLSGAEVQEILNSSRALTQEQNPEP